MKILDIHGNLVSIRPNLATQNFHPESKSKFQLGVRNQLIKKYPHETIYEDFVIPGSQLSIDFIIFRIKKAYEADGSQHTKFNAFYHGDRIAGHRYAQQIKNDVLKSNWCEVNGIELIRIQSIKQLENDDRIF